MLCMPAFFQEIPCNPNKPPQQCEVCLSLIEACKSLGSFHGGNQAPKHPSATEADWHFVSMLLCLMAFRFDNNGAWWLHLWTWRVQQSMTIKQLVSIHFDQFARFWCETVGENSNRCGAWWLELSSSWVLMICIEDKSMMQWTWWIAILLPWKNTILHAVESSWLPLFAWWPVSLLIGFWTSMCGTKLLLSPGCWAMQLADWIGRLRPLHALTAMVNCTSVVTFKMGCMQSSHACTWWLEHFHDFVLVLLKPLVTHFSFGISKWKWGEHMQQQVIKLAWIVVWLIIECFFLWLFLSF